MKDLEVRKITINDEYSDGEDLGMDAIAYTSKAAVSPLVYSSTKGVAFSAHEQKEFKFSDAVKMRIAAPIMVPGQIYRNDTEEYFVEFTEDVIEEIYKKFMLNLNGKPVFNLEHNSENQVPSYILEAILVDSENKMKFIKDEYGIDLPKGSVFVVSQITDEKYYNYLVENDKLGFSIEGFLGLEFTEQLKNKNQNQTEMEKQKFMLPDGEWMMDGKLYIVKDGDIVDIKEEVKEEVSLEAAPEVTEEVKEEIKLEDAPAEIEEEVKEEIKMEDAPVMEDAPAAVEPSMEEKIVSVVDERIEVLINEIADLKSQLLEMKNGEAEVEVEMRKQEFSAADKALGLFKFASNR